MKQQPSPLSVAIFMYLPVMNDRILNRRQQTDMGNGDMMEHQACIHSRQRKSHPSRSFQRRRAKSIGSHQLNDETLTRDQMANLCDCKTFQQQIRSTGKRRLCENDQVHQTRQNSNDTNCTC